MRKRISKAVREEAALLCAIAASWPHTVAVSAVSMHLYGEPYGPVARLAVRAWDAAMRARILAGVRDGSGPDAMRDDYAEAEALLRTGWSPS